MPGPIQPKWGTPRQHSRFVIDLRVVVRAEDQIYGRTRDLSEGGVGAVLTGDLKVNQVVEVEFQLPGRNEPLYMTAEVRYRRGFQYGLKFLNPGEQQLEAIRRATRNLPVVR